MYIPRWATRGGAVCIGKISSAVSGVSRTALAAAPPGGVSAVLSVLTARGTTTSRRSSPSPCPFTYGNTYRGSRVTASGFGAGITASLKREEMAA